VPNEIPHTHIEPLNWLVVVVLLVEHAVHPKDNDAASRRRTPQRLVNGAEIGRAVWYRVKVKPRWRVDHGKPALFDE